MKHRLVVMLTLVGLALAAGGCGVFRLPKLPKRVVRPGASVVAVRLMDTGPRAARYDIDISLYNSNTYPLPMTFAKYELKINGASYRTDIIPKTTIPALGRVTVTLPAVIVGENGPPMGTAFATDGRITLTPEGELRRLLYEIGIPKPSTTFAGEGDVHSLPLSDASAIGSSTP